MSKYRLIESDSYAAAGIEVLTFPGGELHTKIPRLDYTPILFVARMRTWNEVGQAAAVYDALSSWHPTGEVTLFIPYFPGARQDRPSQGTPHTLDIVAKLFKFEPRLLNGVFVFDPHSPVTEDALNISRRNVLMPNLLSGMPIRNDVVGIIAPDAGAVYRALSFQSRFYPGTALVECTKHRDPATGKLSGYIMPPLPVAGRYIIVDDICDGGGTFNLLAEAFKKDKWGECSKLEMFVSHGIFSKGLGAIDKKIEHITTTDSWCRGHQFGPFPHPRGTILPLQALYDGIMETK